jgi:2-polyprenyl-3-methyl-5-hydroxy-6-metoxy-1,4-benzoquinol methylase
MLGSSTFQTRMQHTPVIGGPAPHSAERTARKLAGFALRHVASLGPGLQDGWCLDVGCGNGSITRQLAGGFRTVVGIDVEQDRLSDFQATIEDDPRYRVLRMSADAIGFPNGTFPFVTSFEVLEHVPNVQASVNEIVRVLQPGGTVVISVPQVWFPFENHGMFLNGRMVRQKIPLLPYVRPLHSRIAAARIFSSGELDRLFIGAGLQILETAYAAPQFERAAQASGSWERNFLFLRDFLERCEDTPVLKQLTGVSILKAYGKHI